MSGEIRAHVYYAAADTSAIDEAYHKVSMRIASVPGMLGNELLRSLRDPTAFVVVSRWTSIEAFQQWDRGPAHLDVTAPLRPFREHRMTTSFGIYRVTASY